MLLRSKGSYCLLPISFENIRAGAVETEKDESILQQSSSYTGMSLPLVSSSESPGAQCALLHSGPHQLGPGWHLPGDKSINMGLR